MRTQLSQLTMSQYIDLLCGDYSVIGSGNNLKKEIIRRNIILEYQHICDRSSYTRFIRGTHNRGKARTRLSLYSLCKLFVDLGHIEKARNVMNIAGMRVERFNDERLKAEIDSQIARARKDLSDLENNEEVADEKEVRAFYDRQTAGMMSHFKFQIDPYTMKATLYASLVYQCQQELKAQREALNRKR